jgi:fumarate hydratase, class I
MKNPPPVDLNGAVLYHCGPVMLKEGEVDGERPPGRRPASARSRTGGHHRKLRRAGGDRQGRHGPKTLAALKECGAVYLNAIGGAAQFTRGRWRKVKGVHLMEFGIPEAMWHLK